MRVGSRGLRGISPGHGLEEVYVGGGHDADVGLLHGGGADFQEFSRFEHPQQAGLRRQRQFGHLVEENRSAVGLFEIALAGGDCSGERALLMAEKFAVDGAFGDSPAVDGYIFLVLSRAIGVDDFREEFLSRAALTRDEHGEVDRGHLHGPFDSGDEGGELPMIEKRCFAFRTSSIFLFVV